MEKLDGKSAQSNALKTNHVCVSFCYSQHIIRSMRKIQNNDLLSYYAYNDMTLQTKLILIVTTHI